MSRKFREWQPDASWLFPPSPRDWLPEEHLVYFLLDVTEQIDISPIIKDYGGENGGQPPHHPRMMLVLLLYAYSVGVFSSRKIMQRCQTDAAFRITVGEDIPNFRRIAGFRTRHFQHLQSLFIEVLVLCREAGLLKVGRLSLDGTKVKANASRNKAMSYDRMGPEVDRLQQEIDALLARAEGADVDEDDQFGDLAGDEIPDELKRRESRVAKILEAKQALEEAAKQKAQDHVDKMEAEGRNHRTNPEEAVPDPKAQRNFTDPESKIMKTSNKGVDCRGQMDRHGRVRNGITTFRLRKHVGRDSTIRPCRCGNAQAVANEQQIVVSADVTDQANDVRQTTPMVDQTIKNLDAAGVAEDIEAFTADAGYFSEENMQAVDSNARIDDAFIATGRQKHNDPVPDSPKGAPAERPDAETEDGSPQPDEEREGRVCSAQGDHRTGVRSDQGVPWLSQIPPARLGEDEGGMEPGLHRAQLVEVVQEWCAGSKLRVLKRGSLRGQRRVLGVGFRIGRGLWLVASRFSRLRPHRTENSNFLPVTTHRLADTLLSRQRSDHFILLQLA